MARKRGRAHNGAGSRDVTEPTTPETAPAHTEARARFSPRDIAVVAALGGLAIVLGTVLGLVLTA